MTEPDLSVPVKFKCGMRRYSGPLPGIVWIYGSLSVCVIPLRVVMTGALARISP